jgi:tRNA (guanine37-N1)-methyltransferase
LLDAVARLQPGVLNDEGSHQFDSFNPALDGLLDCPHYTRPEVWHDLPVPPPLLSGHHAQIERWRRDQSLELTARHRPELLAAARAAGRLGKQDEALLNEAVPARLSDGLCSSPKLFIIMGFSILCPAALRTCSQGSRNFKRAPSVARA